ncbi:MAG: DUF3180 domain-containing protein [Gordonia sp. (in: high G+C Gram-positive bacteria)]|uniref:DUF3180 domain-containing protein n=1 Tax=Gordonia sp. (in: high G+C Gram-positive bacteria) TaxID=84139 RepID=UPI0039E3E959
MSYAPNPLPQKPNGEKRLGPTTVRDLIAIAVVAGLGGWILIRYNYGSFPSLPWPAGLTFYVLAALEVVIAFLVRSKVSDGKVGPGPGQLHPINVARSLALAKASSILGAIALGGWLGMLVFLLSRRYLEAATADLPGAIVGAVGGLLLAAAALWLEYCCRAPDDPDPDQSDASPAAADPV